MMWTLALELLLITAAAGSALLAAAAARFRSLVTSLLAAYLGFVANVVLVTLVLSPFREVTRAGLASGEAVFLPAAATGWWLRGRPGLPFAAARAAVRDAMSDPVTALFFAAVVVALGYELMLAASPPNNMDALTYHLAKAAAWAQHRGYYWIPNAPEIEINEYQPLAEQQVLFFFVATKSGALYAAPQYLAELAVVLAAYGSARRLGYRVRAAACSAFLLATFSVVALEAVTAQVDLIAAAFPAVAAYLLLDRGTPQAALAGVAVAFGLATKLTTALVLPVLVLLAALRGRRVCAAALSGSLVAFAAVGVWGYALNTLHTGNPLGAGTGPVQFRGSPSYPGSVAKAFYLMYGLMDLSTLSNHLIDVLGLGGAAAGLAAGAWTLRRSSIRRAIADGVRVALPFLAPLLVLGGGALVAIVARGWGFPIRGPGGILGPLDANLNRTYTRFANEDYSAYGPIGIVAVLAATVVTIHAAVLRRVDARHLVLASALPLFLVAISLGSTWHVFLIRFFLLPAALVAPLSASLFRGRATTAAYALVATLTIALTLTHDEPKPLDNPHGYGRPWNLTQETALLTNSDGGWAEALASYDALVPAHACVGAVLQADEPSYLLYGPHLEHHVFYLSPIPVILQADRWGLSYVVFSAESAQWGSWVTSVFKANKWRVRPLTQAWVLASKPRPDPDHCSPVGERAQPTQPFARTAELVANGYPPIVGLPDQSLYVLQRGVYRHIPDPATMTAHGITLDRVTWLPALPLPLGSPLPLTHVRARNRPPPATSVRA